MSFAKKIERLFYPCQKKLDTLVEAHNESLNKLEETFNNARSLVKGSGLAKKQPQG